MTESTEDWHLQDDDLPPPLNMPINSVSTPLESSPTSIPTADAHSIASLMNSPTSIYTPEDHIREPTYEAFNSIQLIDPHHSSRDLESKIDVCNALSDDPMPIVMPLPYHAGLFAACYPTSSFETLRHHPALDRTAYLHDTEPFNNHRSRTNSPLHQNATYVGDAFRPTEIPYSVNPQDLCSATSIDTQYYDEVSTCDVSGVDWNDDPTSVDLHYSGIHDVETNMHFSTVENANVDIKPMCVNAPSNPSPPLEDHRPAMPFQDLPIYDFHTPWLIDHSTWSTIDNEPQFVPPPSAHQPDYEGKFIVDRDQISLPAETSLSETIDSSLAHHNDFESTDMTFVDTASPPRYVLHRRGSFPLQMEQRPPLSDAFRRGHTRAVSDTGIRGNTSVTSTTDTFQDGSLKICSNCRTTVTPSWRRCAEGKRLLCNACGLYQKLHRKDRPIYQAADGKIKVRRAPHGSTMAQPPVRRHTGFESSGDGDHYDTSSSHPAGSSPTTISCHSSDDSGSDLADPITPEANEVCGICNQGQSSMRTIMQSECTKGLICNLCAMAKAYCDSLATVISVSENETEFTMVHTPHPATSSRDGSYDSDAGTDVVDVSNAEDSSAVEHASSGLTSYADASTVHYGG